MNEPKNGYTEAEARELLRQGYSDEQVSFLTGYAVAWVRRQPVPRKPIHPVLASTRPQD